MIARKSKTVASTFADKRRSRVLSRDEMMAKHSNQDTAISQTQFTKFQEHHTLEARKVCNMLNAVSAQQFGARYILKVNSH